MRRATTTGAAALLLSLAPAAVAGPATAPATTPPAGPTFDDPRYAAWARFGVGSSETFAGDLSWHGKPAHVTVKMTLLAVRDDAVLLDTEMTVQLASGGNAVTLAPRRETITAKIDTLAAVRPLPPQDVKTMGRTFPCRVLELVPRDDDAAGSHKTTVCLNDHVPGGVVRIAAPQAGTMVTMTLTTFDAK